MGVGSGNSNARQTHGTEAVEDRIIAPNEIPESILSNSVLGFTNKVIQDRVPILVLSINKTLQAIIKWWRCRMSKPNTNGAVKVPL